MVYTDFTKYSHADLRKMAQALDPGAVMAAGDPWRKAATTLKEIRKTLTNVSTEAATSWEGTTSDSFHASMLTLAANINEAAAYANDAANTLHNMSEAMAQAKRDMPEEPGNWDKIKDTVGDFFSSEDDHIQVADRKKAEAAAVMQTLAMHYRIATPALKAPPPGPKPTKWADPDKDSQGDQSGAAAAVAAAVSGTSFGTGGTSARSATVSASQRSRTSAPSVGSSAPSRNASTPTDPGIKGGRAQALSKPSTGASSTSGAGISGTPVSRPSGSVPSPVTSGTQTSGLSPTSPTGPASGPITGGGGQPTASPVGPAVQSAPVGPGFAQGKIEFGDKEFSTSSTPLEGTGPRGGRAPGAKQTAGALATPGGAVRGTEPPVGGVRGKQAFTEGGSGLGVRGRLTAEPGARSTGAVAPGAPMSEAQRRKKVREKDGKRPDYLVEDDETWASDKPTNPNVVE
ncbi:WXG100 family type VII secretion target [Kitasatospora aureofaciens]|uniref:WXG100 family type VII secretion target n=1 Tax=Kitasatospora aureofaciens TaxID=1894 RepID=UPI000D12F702|nr:PPE domain-containing protein [Kitasatospora aureofaciens]